MLSFSRSLPFQTNKIKNQTSLIYLGGFVVWNPVLWNKA